MKSKITQILQNSVDVKSKLINDKDMVQKIEKAVVQCIEVLKNDHKIWFCGNGGSAADAQHLAAEFSGRFYHDRDPYFAEALHVNTSYLTAVANDYGYDQVYARLIKAKARRGDILIGMSTSGNSANVVNALMQAKKQDVFVISMTGSGGGKMKAYSDLLLAMPSNDTPRIQEAHMLVGHIICELTEKGLME